MSDNKKYMYGNSKCKIHWENPGFKEILNCDALGDVCEDAATEIARKAGKNYKAERWHSNMKGGRIAARAVCANDAGKYEEASKRTLSKAAMSCAI